LQTSSQVAKLCATRLPWLALGLYTVLFIVELPAFAFWGPFSAIDEQLQYYQAGRNFAQYGFLTTALLPDLSSGSSPAQHPYVYNHQPPGPQLLIGGLIRLFGERYRLIRLVFAALFVLGVAVYLRFCDLIELSGVAYAPLAFLLVRPRTIMHMLDHPAYSVFPLIAFLPIIAVHHHHEANHTRWLWLAVITVFIGSNYLLYGSLLMILSLWTLGGALRILPIRRRELILQLGCAALAVILHLLQTVVVMGPRLFAKELAFTVSNRMFGHPTRQELEAFYDALGLVLYGGHQFSGARFVDAVSATLWLRGYGPLAVAATVVLVVARQRGLRAMKAAATSDEMERATATLARLSVAIVASVLLPIVMFPAFSSDYGLRGMNEFLLGILALASLAFTFKVIGVTGFADGTRRILRLLLLASVTWVGAAQLHGAQQIVVAAARWVRDPPTEAGFLWLARHLDGQVVMTNVDPTVVGFFTKQVAFGGCQDASLAGPTPDPSRCRVRFIRGWPGTLPEPPVAYLWFAEGNAFCSGLSGCVSREDLDRRFKRLFTTRTVAVYDVATRRRRLGLDDHRTGSDSARPSHTEGLPYALGSREIPSVAQNFARP